MIQTSIAFGISLIIAYIVYLIKGAFLISFGIVVGITVISFLCNMKDKYNQSIAIWIHNMIKFYQAQRFYKFVLREEDL